MTFPGLLALVVRTAWAEAPEAPTLGVALDLAPVVAFVGDAFTDVPREDPVVHDVLLRWYRQPGIALRARVGAGWSTSRTTRAYPNPLEGADPDTAWTPADAEDLTVTQRFGAMLGGGVEWRRTRGAVQGWIGGEGLVSAGSSRATTTYGWAYDTAAAERGVVDNGDTRPRTVASGLRLRGALRALAGVDLAVTKQVRLGVEYGLGVDVGVQGRGDTVEEVWNADAGLSLTRTRATGVSGWDLAAGLVPGLGAGFGRGTGAAHLQVLF